MKKFLVIGAICLIAVAVYAAGTTFGTSVTCPSFIGNLTGGITLTEQTAVAVTNGQAVTLASGINYLTSQGSASGSTNTITLVRPSGGESVLFVNSKVSTNLLAVAATGAWNSTALELAAGEAATAYGLSDVDGVGTNAWVGLAL